MTVKGFTARQKLQAIQGKYYCGGHVKWESKVGDFYTIVRDDLEVFQIVRQDGDEFVTSPVWEGASGESSFPVKGFTTEEFGPNRVLIPEWIVKDLEIS